MLLTESVKVKWHGNNREQYENKGYIYTKRGEYFKVKINDLLKTQFNREILKVKCDICHSNEVFEITGEKYNGSLARNQNMFACVECEKKKRNNQYEGMKIGRLTVIKYLGYYEKNKDGKKYWFDCLCECGSTCIKSYNYLFDKRLDLKSCGCWNSERTIHFNRNTKTSFDNEYYIKDNIYYIKSTNYNTIYETMVDKDFFEYLKQKDRRLSVDSRGYAFISQENTSKQMFIHNLVIFGEDYYNKNMNINVDHIDSESIRDNRKINLRPANDFENTQNAKRRKDNSCGIKGFTINYKADRPTAHIIVKIQAYKKRHQKSFSLSPKGLKSAIVWNINKRKELHREFANHGISMKNKSIDVIVKEQEYIFISNLNEVQKKIFDNNGYVRDLIKNKPRKNN